MWKSSPQLPVRARPNWFQASSVTIEPQIRLRYNCPGVTSGEAPPLAPTTSAAQFTRSCKGSPDLERLGVIQVAIPVQFKAHESLP